MYTPVRTDDGPRPLLVVLGEDEAQHRGHNALDRPRRDVPERVAERHRAGEAELERGDDGDAGHVQVAVCVP